MRILVTGGAGYVGSVSVDRFVEAGHDVVVLDDLTTGHRGAVPAGATLEVGSYGDADFVRELLERHRIEAVLHCAARSLVGESGQDPAKYYRDNVAGGVALLEALRLGDVGRFVFSSSGEDARELYLMSVGAEAPVPLTNDPADDSAPSWGVEP